MHYPLERFDNIPRPVQKQLATVGIFNTDELLNQASTPSQRSRLSQKTDISTDDLCRWAGMADLVRIKGIGPAFAEFLIMSGVVGNVQQFLSALKADYHPGDGEQAARRIADRKVIRSAASELVKQLKLFAENQSVAHRSPTIRELTEAAEEAVELRPRLVLAEPLEEDTFRKSVLERQEKARKISRRTKLALFVIVLGALSSVLLIFFVWAKVRLDQLSSEGDILTALVAELWRAAFNSLLLSLAALTVITCLMLLSLYTIHEAITRFLDTRLVFLLFNAPPHRDFYSKVESLGLESQKRGVRWGIIVVVISAIGLVVYSSVSTLNRPDEALEAFGSRIALPIAAAGALMVLVVAFPVVRFYLRELQIGQTAQDVSFQRYLIYLLSKLAWLPILIVILSQLLFPGVFTVHRYLYRSFILPELEAEIMKKRSVIISLDIANETIQRRRDRLLESFDNTVVDELPDYGSVSAQDTAVFGFIIPSALKIAVWWFFAAVVLLFVTPYFVLGKWRRGLFYVAVLAMSFTIENALQQSAPTWFSLQPRSVSSALVVAFAVFANALFFDWLFDTLSERKKMCPSCQFQVDQDVAYCPMCGLVQP